MGKISKCLDHHEHIVASVQTGEAIVSIGKRLGLSVPALSNYLARRGIYSQRPKNTPKKIDGDRLREMLAAGRTHEQIAEALGVHFSSIQKRCGKLGLETARTGPRSGLDHPEWNGGRRLDKHGYVMVHVPMHPQTRTSTKTVVEHRLVMEVHLGRYLDPKEVVHHKDDHPRHNWPDNLEVFASNADHLRHELTGLPQATRRSSIPGAYKSSQRLDRCPDEDETLALCPSEIRQRLAWYIESHRPTNEHRSLSLRTLLRSGAWRLPFQWPSTG